MPGENVVDQERLSKDQSEARILVNEGQRRINLIWEVTQAVIAISVVLSNMIVGVYSAFTTGQPQEPPFILSSSMFLVIGSYFSRTNHQSIGGIGEKPAQPYVGR